MTALLSPALESATAGLPTQTTRVDQLPARCPTCAGSYFWWGIGLFVATVAIVLTFSSAYETIVNPGLARYCRGGGYPNVWRQAGKPAWATDARLAALCAVTEWIRDETGIGLDE